MKGHKWIIVGSIITLLVAVLLGFLAALWPNAVQLRFDPDQIEGSAVLIEDKPYTLSYRQHKALLSVLNSAQPGSGLGQPLKKSLVLYRFSKSPDEILLREGGYIYGEEQFLTPRLGEILEELED